MTIEIDRPSDEFRNINKIPKIKVPPGRDFEEAYFTVQNVLWNMEMEYGNLSEFEKSKWYKKRAREKLEVIREFRMRIDRELDFRVARSPVRIVMVE